jgi:hypothetical protein
VNGKDLRREDKGALTNWMQPLGQGSLPSKKTLATTPIKNADDRRLAKCSNKEGTMKTERKYKTQFGAGKFEISYQKRKGVPLSNRAWSPEETER